MSRYSSPVLVILAGLAAGAMPSTARSSALLQAAALSGDASSLTLTLGLSAPVQPVVFVLGGPRRVVVDLPGTRCAAALRLPAGAGMVVGLRGAVRERSTYRLVLELRGQPTVTPRVVSLGTARSYQLQIRLGAAPVFASVPASHPPSIPSPTAALSPAAPAVALPVRVVSPAHAPGGMDRDVVVAIDAGHGGEDPGASGPGGTHEKDVTLAIARALAARINARPGMHAVLTRDSDRLIDLRERMERARAANADLFVSIHADAVRNRAITGASVYTLSDHGASSEAALWLANRENTAVMKGGVSLASVNANLASVLVDAAQSQNMGASVEAADEVLAALDRVGAIRKRVVQHAGFMVLKSPDAPSMLIETAYISNPAEERSLASRAYQERLAGAIEAGIVTYFQHHRPDGTRYASTPRVAPAPVTPTVADDSGV
jgi:N-acetylmuramoyl-L-alanine amidase